MKKWFPACVAIPDGKPCEIRLVDALGVYGGSMGLCFFHDDGHWHKIDPPTQILAEVHSFHPVEIVDETT